MNIIKWKGLDVDPMIISESATTKVDIGQVDTQFNESTQQSGITMLYPRIEAIHEGRTRNYNRYTAEKLKGNYELKSGVYSWTDPYPKPVIHNHDVNTEATGRVHAATWTDFTQAGRPGIIVTPKITQEKAIRDIMEGRLLTVSIGATTNAAICSLCHTDIINEGYCGHMRGEEYDGHTVEWIAGDLWFDELSWVNVPADPDAMILGNNLTNTADVAGHQESIQVKSTPEAAETVEESTTLTPEDAVVKSVSESQEKEAEKVEKTPSTTPETPQEQTLETPDTTVLETAQEETTPEANVDLTEAPVVEEAPEVEPEADPVVTEQATEETPEAEQKTLEEQLEDAQDALKEAQQELTDVKEELEDVKAANLTLVKEKKAQTVEFLVDLRMALGKEADREDAIRKYAERSTESVNDSIQDLLSEKPELQVKRTVEAVEKPTGQAITESKVLATEKAKVISNEDVLLSLLSGQR